MVATIYTITNKKTLEQQVKRMQQILTRAQVLAANDVGVLLSTGSKEASINHINEQVRDILIRECIDEFFDCIEELRECL